MKFFTAVKTATFAESAFKAAGLDIEAAANAGNVDVLKNALAAASAAKPADANVEQALADAVKENAELTGKLNAAVAFKADADKHAAVCAALKDAGIDASDAAKIKEQIDAKATSAAVNIVARSGHEPIADEIAADASAKKAEKKAAEEPGLTGRERMARDFHKQAYELNRKPGRN